MRELGKNEFIERYFTDALKVIYMGYDRSEVDNVSVEKNLGKCYSNKTRLREILSSHPNWNDDLQMIIKDVELREQLDKKAIRYLKNFSASYFSKKEKELQYNTEEEGEALRADLIKRRHNLSILIDLIEGYTNEEGLLDKDLIWDDITLYKGQKASRVLRKYTEFLGEEKDFKVYNCYLPEVRDKDTGEYGNYYTYEQLFAYVSDKISPKIRRQKIYISINPLDYLTQSHGNSWTSCHSLENQGCYHGATLTMMVDSSSIITYTINVEQSDHPSLERKILRSTIFMNEEGDFMQMCQYPQQSMNTQFLKAVYDTLNEINEYSPLTQDVYRSIDSEGYRGYDDFAYDKRYAIALLKSNNTCEFYLKIGDYAYALDDQNEYIEEEDTLLAGHRLYCECCEERVSEEDLYYVRGLGEYRCIYCIENNPDIVWDSYNDEYVDITWVDMFETEDGEWYRCDDAPRVGYFYCGYHQEYEKEDDYFGEDSYGDSICYDAFEEGYVICANCDDIIERRDAYEYNGRYYCESCFEEIKEDDDTIDDITTFVIDEDVEGLLL